MKEKKVSASLIVEESMMYLCIFENGKRVMKIPHDEGIKLQGALNQLLPYKDGQYVWPGLLPYYVPPWDVTSGGEGINVQRSDHNVHGHDINRERG